MKPLAIDTSDIILEKSPDDMQKLSREIPAGHSAGQSHTVAPLVTEFLETLPHRSPATRLVYARVLRQLTDWIAARPGSEGGFLPEQLSVTALSIYLAEMGTNGYSLSHRVRIKAVASGFARWLVEEKGLLTRNPARGVTLPPQQMLAPRELSSEQRYVLRNLAERDNTARGAALFALGYWAGCRISDVAHLKVDNAHIGPKLGWIRTGFKAGKMREIDLINEARKPLFEYLRQERPDSASPFFFLSQRHERLTESGIHQWFRTLKTRARKDEWDLVQDITFHDLRHDFAHRARTAGWSLEELSYYLGHVTARGLPAIATTVRYTQVSREQVRSKLALLRG